LSPGWDWKRRAEVILHLGYEELTALRDGAVLALAQESPSNNPSSHGPVTVRSRLLALVPDLGGDVGIETLREQSEWADAFGLIVECLRREMEVAVAATHPADEDAVASYFGFAHAYSALDRLHRMGRQMEAMIEVLSGDTLIELNAAEFVFPD
jgi:hypothetical protein